MSTALHDAPTVRMPRKKTAPAAKANRLIWFAILGRENLPKQDIVARNQRQPLAPTSASGAMWAHRVLATNGWY